MSDRSPIYAASPDHAVELQRALRICLSGAAAPQALTFENADFAGWVRRMFLPVLAPHVLAAYEMARQGDGESLIRADAALDLNAASRLAGHELLALRTGARHLPVLRRFAGAVADGKANGHFATVIALQAADFSVAHLPLLQCLLYCEWQAGRAPGSAGGMDGFFHSAAFALPLLPPLLASHCLTHGPVMGMPSPRRKDRA